MNLVHVYLPRACFKVLKQLTRSRRKIQINCQDSHSAYSKICSIWKKEKQIQYLKVTNNISFPEARKLAETADNQASHSYASAVKQSAIDNNTKETNSVSTQTTSVSTQTELTSQQAHDMISTLKLGGYRVATSYNMISTSLQRRFTYVGSTWK